MISFNPSQILIDILTRMLIAIVAFILGLAAFPALFIPDIAGEMTGFSSSLAGLTEIRATYGGFHLGFTMFLLWCCSAVERYQYALFAIALMMGGSGIARIGGLILDGMPTSLHYSGLGIELSVALAAIWLMSLRVNSSA